jgi:GNAT superfamily N-acetyltransferase
MTDDFISIPDAPAIPGLRFRHYRGESDYPGMEKAIAASAAADGVERVTTIEDLNSTYTHLTNCDPFQDMIFAEVNGEIIGYSRGWWFFEEDSGTYLYGLVGFLVPSWRRKGIGQGMLQWSENRMRQVASGHPAGKPKYFQCFVSQTESSSEAMLQKSGYNPARYMYDMVRPTLEDIPDFPLPQGLEVRPSRPENYRQIWDAGIEAFRDHWGFSEPLEEDYQAWLSNTSFFQPHLWQVAWDIASNQVAGHVLTFINQAENEKFGRKRGYTESIAVRRPWRKRGLARALISRSLRSQKEEGMTESALGVDTENLSGATRIYEECGFRVARKNTIYRKSL